MLGRERQRAARMLAPILKGQKLSDLNRPVLGYAEGTVERITFGDFPMPLIAFWMAPAIVMMPAANAATDAWFKMAFAPWNACMGLMGGRGYL